MKVAKLNQLTTPQQWLKALRNNRERPESHWDAPRIDAKDIAAIQHDALTFATSVCREMAHTFYHKEMADAAEACATKIEQNETSQTQ